MPAQEGVKVVEEIKTVIENYKIIIKWVEKLDETHESRNTQNVFSTLSSPGSYIPALKDYVESSELIPRGKKKLLFDDISTLQQKTKTRGEIPTNDKSHESPLVHLLYLAIEKKKLLFDREQQPKEQNWGRLGAFPDYLRELEFKSLGHGTSERYWPGVPTCLMISVPIWTSEAEYSVSISASPDKFKYVKKLLENCWDHRRDRFKQLEQSCGEDARVRVKRLRRFSKKLLHKYESLFNDLDEMQFNWTPSNLKPDSHVPVYFPVISSTWTPAGEYLPACGLDRLRFSILRPPEAEKEEQRARQRPFNFTAMPTEESCAEWDGFIDFMSRPEHREVSWY